MAGKVLVVILVVLVASGVLAFFMIAPTHIPPLANQTGTVPQTFTQESVGGLELVVSINATELRLGERLGISVSLLNTLPSEFNLSLSNLWKVKGFPVAMWPACEYYERWIGYATRGEPIEFMIEKGNLSLGELQTASSNSTVAITGCGPGGHSTLPIDYISFKPNSTEFSVNENPPGAYNDSYPLVSNFSVNGYWTYPINASEAAFVSSSPVHCVEGSNTLCYYYRYPELTPIVQHLFTQGWYTLVVSDEWGQFITAKVHVR